MTSAFKKSVCIAVCFVLSLVVLPETPAFPNDDIKTESHTETPISDDDRDHWSFRSLARPVVPGIPSNATEGLSRWPRNDIDRFILSRLVKRKLQPAPEADCLTLLRRVTFDLTGLPPTTEEILSFETDSRDDAYDQLVSRLLDSPSYGERWAQHWLDLARYAETDGFEHDKVRHDAWRYRDWVINALNDDMPFDRFVKLQLSGDETEPQHRAATGFLTCGPDMPDINLQDERRHNFLNGITSTVGSVFLGVQLGCAECHDHKYDPISQFDFYRLRAFFDPAFTFKKNKGVELPKGNHSDAASHLMIRGDFRRTGPAVEPAFLRISNPSNRRPSVEADRKNLRTQLASWIVRPDNPLSMRTFANRLWHYHFGEGLSQTPSDLGLTGDYPVHGELLDWLATELPRQGWSLKQMHRLIVTSATYRQASRLPPDSSQDQKKRWATALKTDGMNLLHSRGRRRRLEGEAIRDAMLASSGSLSNRRGGPGIRPPLPHEITHTLLKNQWPVSEDPADYTRRSIYLFVRRNLRYPLFEAFDKPDTNVSCPRRNESTIAPQALTLLNSKLSLDAAKALAASASAEARSSQQIIQELYLRTLGRRPSAQETSIALDFLKDSAKQRQPDSRDSNEVDSDHALVDLCLSLFNLNEFLYID